MTILACCLLIILALFIRYMPNYIVTQGSTGVDQWFWKAYIETLRDQKKMPPQLPQFLLDEKQWYPPLFPFIIAKLPAVIFEKYANQLSILIDLLRMSLLLLAVWWLSESLLALVVAGVIYSITPLLISYNMQLNPRGLAALFLDAMWLCILGVFFHKLPDYFLILAFIFSGLILITHKMTTQILFFTTICFALFLQDFRFLLLIPCSMLAALILSGGFYRYVFLAHIDIVRFWYKNHYWSGSNPILESPIYGEKDYETPTKYYRKGLKAWIRRLQFIIGFNPWMPAGVVVTLAAIYYQQPFSDVSGFVIAWFILSFLFALLTTLVSALRCLGNGYLYGYNGIFPVALFFALTAEHLAQTWYWLTIFISTIIACGVALFAFFKALKSSRTMKVETDLDKAICYLRGLPDGVVMCIPQHWHDVVAYRTGKKVAYGGHGYGFKLLQPFFPRLMQPIQSLIEQYQVRYLLTLPQYLNAKFIEDLPQSTAVDFGDYRIYCFTEQTHSLQQLR